MTSVRSAATTRPTSAGLRPPPVYRETNLALYRTFAQPVVRTLVNSPLAEWTHRLHPARLQYELFSDANPMMAPVAAMAAQVREHRRPIAAANPFIAMQENASRQIVTALDAWRDASEAMAERCFLTVYGSPTLQAAAGIDRCRVLWKAGKIRCIASYCRNGLPTSSRASAGGLREASSVRCSTPACRSRGRRRGFEACAVFAARGLPLRLQGARARPVQHAAGRPGNTLAAIPACPGCGAGSRRSN